MLFSLFLALKYLKPKRTVTSVVSLISVLGVVLGVAIIIIVRAVMTGFGDMWQEKILDFKPHIIIRAFAGKVIQDEEALCRRLELVEGVKAASPSLETRVLVENHRRVVAPVLIGVDPVRAKNIMQLEHMRAGEFDVTGDAVVLGTDLAQELGVDVGDDLLVYSPMNLVSTDEVYFPDRLIVKGIFESGQRDFDSGYIITSLAVTRDLMGMSSGVYSIHLKTEQPANFEFFNKVVGRVEDITPNFQVQTWQEIDRQIFNALAVEKNMMVILLMFITVVAIFCVTNTLIVLTVQKTDEIGLLKALGFSSRQVMGAFVIYGWIQCLIGTLLGIVAAFLILYNLQSMVNGLGMLGVEVFPKAIYGLNAIPWRIIPSEVVNVAMSVIMFCTVASFLPAWRAARMDPVVALRKE
ncbi:MAG: ABC transporter permease [Kiritimatiellae bacterium]|nr:ABC transporter permease [Kiritimatiellia bacterium]